MLEVESDIVGGKWSADIDWQALAVKAASAAVLGAGMTPHRDLNVEIAVRFSSDDEVRMLNREYRGKDKPTNVLSFPMLEPDQVGEALAGREDDILLGDIVLAEETVAREAAEKGIAMKDHAAHLIVHGTLHLLGHDHGDDDDAEAMESLETRILATLDIDDPYREVTDTPDA